LATTSKSEAAPVSVRRLLFRWLLLPLTALLAGSAFLGYPVALYPATGVYDWALMDTAYSLSRLVNARAGEGVFRVTPEDDTLLRTDEFDRIYYSVRTLDGELLAGDPQLTVPGGDALASGELLYDSVIDDEHVRVAAVIVSRDEVPLVVQVGETTVKRARLAGQILSAVIFIEVLLIATVILLVTLGIDRGLAPLRCLGAEIEARSHRDLRPVPEAEAPLEAQPVVRALNSLLSQLAGVLRAQEQFVANAAHQLRTPLAGLRMQIEYALSSDDPEEWRRALRTIAPVTDRAIHLVHQLLTLANTEGGSGVAGAMRALDLREVIEEVAAEWMPKAIAKDIDLGLELTPAPVHGQRFLLAELLSNLLDNALTYSPPGARVTVRAARTGAATLLEVEDTGPGIPEAERSRVFGRFYRLAGAPGEGCGLGLAIVAEIAQLHEARVDIRTPAAGEGTLVVVSFPAPREDSGAGRPLASAPREQELPAEHPRAEDSVPQRA
jgi:two-component system, OmpR family, sensor histidine kinase TctE